MDDVVALGQQVVGQGQARQEDGGRGAMRPGKLSTLNGIIAKVCCFDLLKL